MAFFRTRPVKQATYFAIAASAALYAGFCTKFVNET
jgi:hypothetical protein